MEISSEPTAWQRLSERTLSVATIRQIDQIAIEQYHMHSLVLMENAASNCARWIINNREARSRVVILCGRGNNGGDGLAIMRHLQLANWDCMAVLLGPIERLSPDAHANWQILAADGDSRQRVFIVSGVDSVAPSADATVGAFAPQPGSTKMDAIERAIAGADVIVDAMLGSGASGQPREPFARWIELANSASAAWRIAIDIPTGLDAETGSVATCCFRADATLTFVARKPGFGSPLAQNVLGQVVVLPIGIPQALVERLLVAEPRRGSDGEVS